MKIFLALHEHIVYDFLIFSHVKKRNLLSVVKLVILYLEIIAKLILNTCFHCIRKNKSGDIKDYYLGRCVHFAFFSSNQKARFKLTTIDRLANNSSSSQFYKNIQVFLFFFFKVGKCFFWQISTFERTYSLCYGLQSN